MHQRIIVLFSDGGDNSSKIQEDSIIRLSRAQNIPIFSIAYGMTDEKPLKKLSSATGGKMYRIYTIKEFPYVLADIVKSIKIIIVFHINHQNLLIFIKLDYLFN